MLNKVNRFPAPILHPALPNHPPSSIVTTQCFIIEGISSFHNLLENKMEKYSFVAQMPNQPGSLQRAAEIVKRYHGNINRIHFDRRIDPQTVFFEATCTPGNYLHIADELKEIGYLQTSLKTLNFLKFHVQLPHRAGALFEFLHYTSNAGANIAYIDFDESGTHPERVTVSLNIEESGIADNLLNSLKSHYPLEIVEYDTTGERLDDTVFYVRFAQKIRPLIEETEEQFLLSFLHDINHIVQDLTNRGKDPREVFESILQAGTTLKDTSGDGFYADVQKVAVTESATVFCFQLPGGGNVYIVDTPDEQVMVDTGYGIYYPDIIAMFQHYGLGDPKKLTRILITHADADHCGAAGFYTIPSYLHPGTLDIIREANRAYGSRSQDSILEEVYTTMIGLFSRFHPPKDHILLTPQGDGHRSIFPILGHVAIGNLEFEILESLGGHQYGQIFLFCPSEGVLFTADTLINFHSLSQERREYSSLADFLVTSVNVDSELAKTERKAIVQLAMETDENLAPKGKRCIICGGHGGVSVLENGKLEVFGDVEHYIPVFRKMNSEDKG
jgi:glyoxylase-like metal-dependent hydrolase (beta-lactamase superfamily II)